MTEIKVTAHFKLKELVHPEFFLFWDDFQIMRMFDRELLKDLEKIRVACGYPLYINGVFAGKEFNYSGARPQNSTVGAKYSMHKYFKAFDLKAYDKTAEDIFKVVDNLFADKQLNAVTRCENPSVTKTWLHIDSLYTGDNKLVVFNP